MKLKKLPYSFSVCKLNTVSGIDLNRELYFLGKTDEETSLVCKTEDVPDNVTDRDDGWRGFRIQGVLDFSLIGVLSGISGILAKNEIGIFVVSTYNTDYVFVKSENWEKALQTLSAEGYVIE